MSHTIVIDANFAKVTKQFDALAKTFDKSFQKRTGIKIFDEGTTKKFLEESAKSVDKLKGKISDVTKEIERERKALTDVNKTAKDREKTEERINHLFHERNEMTKQAMNIDRTSQSVKKKSAGLMSRLTGVGAAAGEGGGMMGGLGAMAMSPMGMAAGALGAFAVGRGMNAFNTYKGGLDSRIKLRGMGYNDVSGANGQMQGMGFDPEQTRQMQADSTDAFGRKGSSLGQVAGRAKFERGFGLDAGTMNGVGGQMRSVMGNQGALRAVAKLQGAIMAEEIDGAIGPYLQTAADMLTDINQNGMALDGSALNALAVLSQDKGYGPERAGNFLGGINNAMKGASGEKAAFFQASAAASGLGGGMIGGAEANMRQGLFGLDKQKASGFLDKGQMGALDSIGLFDKNHAQKFAKGMLDTIDSQKFNTGTSQGQLAQGQFTAQQFGLQGPAEGMQYYNAIKALASPGASEESRSKAKKTLEDLGKSPEQKNADRLEKLMRSSEMSLKHLDAIRKVEEEKLGARLVPVAELISKTLLNIDKVLSAVLGVIPGFETYDEEKSRKISTGTVDQQLLSTMTPDEIAKMKIENESKYSNAIASERKNVQSWDASGNIHNSQSGAMIRQTGMDKSISGNILDAISKMPADIRRMVELNEAQLKKQAEANIDRKKIVAKPEGALKQGTTK